MTDDTFVLPEPGDMMTRLQKVMDGHHVEYGLYRPFIDRHAGSALTDLGFVMAWMLAVHDYTAGLPVAVVPVMEIATHKYARALLDDEAVLSRVLALLGAMGLPND